MKTIFDANNALLKEGCACTTEDFSPGRQCQFPKESRGLEASLSIEVYDLTAGVNDESAKLVDGFKPTRYELECLARHYVDISEMRNFYETAYESPGVYLTDEIFARRRLDTIYGVLGEAAFEKAVAPNQKKWGEKWARFHSASPCEHCGEKFAPEDHDPNECSHRT